MFSQPCMESCWTKVLYYYLLYYFDMRIIGHKCWSRYALIAPNSVVLLGFEVRGKDFRLEKYTFCLSFKFLPSIHIFLSIEYCIYRILWFSIIQAPIESLLIYHFWTKWKVIRSLEYWYDKSFHFLRGLSIMISWRCYLNRRSFQKLSLFDVFVTVW